MTWQGRKYSLFTIPGTNWVAVVIKFTKDIQKTGQQLLTIFLMVAIILGFVATAVIFILSRQLSKPIRKLAETATEFATGNMEVKAAEEGSWETVYLAQSFNQLVTEVKHLLAEKQKSLEVAENLAQMLQKQKQQMKENLFILQKVVEEAAKGNLTVNAPLCEGEGE